MAEWNEKNKYTANKDDWEWDCGIGPMDLWKSFGSRSSMSFSEFDIWERSLFKPQVSAKVTQSPVSTLKQLIAMQGRLDECSTNLLYCRIVLCETF